MVSHQYQVLNFKYVACHIHNSFRREPTFGLFLYEYLAHFRCINITAFSSIFPFCPVSNFQDSWLSFRLCKCNYHADRVEENISIPPVHCCFPGLWALPRSRINRTLAEQWTQATLRQLHSLSIKLDSSFASSHILKARVLETLAAESSQLCK